MTISDLITELQKLPLGTTISVISPAGAAFLQADVNVLYNPEAQRVFIDATAVIHNPMADLQTIRAKSVPVEAIKKDANQ